MKVLHISGEDDFSALDFKNLHVPIEEAYDKAFHSESGIWEFRPNGWATAMNFPNCRVTKEFLSFIKDALGDPERMQAENFFVLDK